MNNAISSPRRLSIGLVGILVLVLAALFFAYSPLWQNDFIGFDDNIYITGNEQVQQGLSFEGLKWAFSFADKPGTYWHPLIWLSLQLDHELFGLNPAGYHSMNLAIHTANALLIFLLLRRITRESAAAGITAALFLLHPLNVESVAWAVERKTILCTFFGLLAVGSYLRYVQRPSLIRYLAVFFLFAFGLMTKSMLVTLPCALLLLDFWPLARFARLPATGTVSTNCARLSVRSLVVEKIPLLLLSVTSFLLTMLSLRGRVVEPPTPDFAVRIENMVVSYARYFKMIVWPTDLVVFNPPRMTHYPVWQIVAALLVLAGLIYFSVKTLRSRPWWFVGLCWYAGTLFPASGLVRSGLWPEHADRFIYLPSFGLLLIIACEGQRLAQKGRIWRQAVVSLGVIAIVLLAVATQRQVRVWRDDVTLFEQTVKVTSNNLFAHHTLGKIYFRRGEQIKAFTHFAAEKAIDPLNPDMEVYLGYTAFLKKDYTFAQSQFERVLAVTPDNLDALYLLAKTYEETGNLRWAEEYYRKGLASRSLDLYSMRPLFKERLNHLGVAY